jgi:hypothetical protein
VANVVLGIVNIILFVIWLSLIRMQAVSPEKNYGEYNFDQLSFQISVLETVIAVLGVGLAILGVLGFNLVVERAEMKADKAARDVVTRLHSDGQLYPRPFGGGKSTHGLPNAAGVATGEAQREQDA